MVNVINALLKRITINTLKIEEYVEVVVIKTEENNFVFEFDNVDILKCVFVEHKEKYSILVKIYEFDNPDNSEMFCIIDNCAREYHNKYFHSFTFKCIYDIEMTNGDFVKGTISDKKLKNFIRDNGFIT